MKKITIATSINPNSKALEAQKVAIKSWLDLGFRVIVLNEPDEVDLLSKEFGFTASTDDIRFIGAERTGLMVIGRPMIYIYDAVRLLADTDSHVVGLVNADIILRGDGLMERLHQQLTNTPGLLFGHRTDVATADSVTGEVMDWGFDYFFFNRALGPLVIENRPFWFGIPWWDWWFPLAFEMNELSAHRLTTQIAYHVKHPKQWDNRSWYQVAPTFADFFEWSLCGKCGKKDKPTLTPYYKDAGWARIMTIPRAELAQITAK